MIVSGDPRLRILGTLLVAAALPGCVTIPTDDPAAMPDPLEGFNRPMHTFNSGLDRFIFRPIAVGYDFVTPRPVETVVRNFFVNLRGPVDIGNSLLQGNWRAAGHNTGRLLVNSTIGIGGLFDVGRQMGLERQAEDFGQTLAAWGVGSGPFVVLPFVGPLTPRGAFGAFADSYAAPLLDNGLTIGEENTRDKLVILNGISQRSQYLDSDRALREAADSYALARATYLQRRQAAIRNEGEPPEQFARRFQQPQPAQDRAAEQVPDEPARAPLIECEPPRRDACPKILRPVCATRDTGVRCVTTPCESTEEVTYANACVACADRDVYGYRDGVCEN